MAYGVFKFLETFVFFKLFLPFKEITESSFPLREWMKYRMWLTETFSLIIKFVLADGFWC